MIIIIICHQKCNERQQGKEKHEELPRKHSKTPGPERASERNKLSLGFSLTCLWLSSMVTNGKMIYIVFLALKNPYF